MGGVRPTRPAGTTLVSSVVLPTVIYNVMKKTRIIMIIHLSEVNLNHSTPIILPEFHAEISRFLAK